MFSYIGFGSCILELNRIIRKEGFFNVRVLCVSCRKIIKGFINFRFIYGYEYNIKVKYF